MSPTDKGGNTPESPETPEPNGDNSPSETTPIEPISEQPGGIDLTKPAADGADSATQNAPVQDPAVGAPIGTDYPSPESFASAQPAGGMNKKVVAIIAAVVVAIIAIAAILFVVLKDDSISAEQQIKNTTEKYVEITNTGKVAGLNAVFCQANLDRIGDNPEDMPAADPQIELDQYDNITIDGDTAVAEVTISATDQPELGTQQTSIPFVKEDGWKVCL